MLHPEHSHYTDGECYSLNTVTVLTVECYILNTVTVLTGLWIQPEHSHCTDGAVATATTVVYLSRQGDCSQPGETQFGSRRGAGSDRLWSTVNLLPIPRG
jgi:hypothetical protein